MYALPWATTYTQLMWCFGLIHLCQMPPCIFHLQSNYVSSQAQLNSQLSTIWANLAREIGASEAEIDAALQPWSTAVNILAIIASFLVNLHTK